MKDDTKQSAHSPAQKANEKRKTSEVPDKENPEEIQDQQGAVENQQTEKKEETVSKSKYLRALADYQNLARRIEREREEIQELASERIVIKLLPVLDDLELAKHNVKDKGIELIYDKLWKILQTEGLDKIEIAEKDEFNPSTMECIDAQEGGEKLITVRTGYIMKGKVIRPAQVRVVQ